MTDVAASRRAPRFSIVTIAYNDLDGLRLAADSILFQDLCDWEWIVVDGGSRDGSVEFLSGIGDPRVSFTTEPDRGIYNAMNKGIDRARGDYLIFINSGDAIATTGELTAAARDLAGEPDLLYGDGIEVDPDTGDGHYKRARSHRFGWYSMFAHHQAIYYRRQLFDRLRYDETFRLAADWALTLDVLRSSRKVVRVHRAVCRFTRGGASFAGSTEQADSEARRVYREHARLPAILAMLTYGMKIGINRVRTRFPRLYDRLRTRRRF